MVMLKAPTMRQRPAPKQKFKVIVDGYDEIEIASIDSFPASDPPGWIEAKAHPYPKEGPAPTTKAAPRKRHR